MGNPKPMTFSVNICSPYDRWKGINALGEAVKLADDLGFYAVQMGEHIFEPTQRPPEASVVWYDNFVLGAHLATITRRLRFVFNVVVIPYRPPIIMAKMIATLDIVSDGRLIIGIGVGSRQQEFEALKVPFQRRFSMTNEYVRAMQALWIQEEPSFQGKYISFPKMAFYPKCLQQPHVKLWSGGSGPKARERAAELADGWSPSSGRFAELAPGIPWVKGKARELGRDPEKLEFSYRLAVGVPDAWLEAVMRRSPAQQYTAPDNPHTPAEIIEAIHRYHQGGFNHLMITFAWKDPRDFMSKMEGFARDVMPEFAGKGASV